jgi:hypothetical protein
VVISAALPSSGAIGENPNDLSLSLSLSYHDDLPSPEVAVLPHGRESTMDREPVVVPLSIDLIHHFSYTKTILRNPEMPKSQERTWNFIINPETTPTFFKLAQKLYHNQFQSNFFT